ncbi:DUF4946 domain-containing protein [Pseudomonas aeruginosa]|uniref:DUF4946 domain-containing protein n=2 Tax=Pseudomonas aeruginosa TaxID=287 RepID=UPI000E32B41C|nr:DUF4946 domain-containing protein [Pseudomonas aeruginosa]MBG3897900.1 DUF4946 domain-containing protein [Pseudomonas aeruginosa]NQC04710.1 DUF4946 domain-containing protein [Pseudomonas aeruginosa]RTT92183.1 DUF4946 domain-containing protein [Pseudomonas aeruginosa]TEG82818.1 DUF4946 domain-containing protein [Pseudomonas aeruginosa]HBO9153228.1 DUF4946 domain-containing protein [Pseudomonas aeruginosa]
MRSKASGLALVVVAGLVAGCASSGYQPEVDWPAGWQVITESIPPEASDVEQLGSRQLATKLGPGGEKEASIELLSLKMMEEESVEIDGQFQSVFDVVQSGYRKAGLGSRCTTPIRSNLGGLASLETHCRISQGNEVLLTQIVAMALGQRAMYSLVYTASPVNSVVYRQSYLRTRASLVLR